MDNLTIMFAAFLASMQASLPLPHQPPASTLPVVAQALKKPKAIPPPMPVVPHRAAPAPETSPSCPGYGQPDRFGNLNYCL